MDGGLNLGFNGMIAGYGAAPAMSYGLADFGASFAAGPAPVTYAASPLAMSYGLSAAAPAAYNMHEISAPLMNYQPTQMSYAMPEPVMQYSAVAPAPAMHYSAPQIVGSHMQYAAVAPVQVSVHQAPPQIVDTQGKLIEINHNTSFRL